MKDALAVALVHFVWQGALVAVVGWGLMRLAKIPSIRYAIGVATMVAMLAAPVLTFLTVRSADPEVATAGAPTQVATEPGGVIRTNDSFLAQNVATDNSVRGFVVPTTWILGLWMFGVVVLSLRFVGGLAMAHRLATRTLVPVGDDLQRLAAQLASQLKVRGMVRVCESASVAVPVMVGWLRPVVVLPPAALAALPLAQLEALLAHEFAHIRRHDYLVNLLQTAVETICFYHPAVWWISRQVRLEREHCCDDVAVTVCDRLTYVTALSTLASLTTPQLALAATGGSLRDRVRRLVEPNTHSVSAKGGWMAMLPILLVVSLVAPQAWSPVSPEQVATTTPVVVEQVKPVPVVKLVRPEILPLVIKVRPDVAKVTPLSLKVTPLSLKLTPLAVRVTPLSLKVAPVLVPLLKQRPIREVRKVEPSPLVVQEREVAAQTVRAVEDRRRVLRELEQVRRSQVAEVEVELVALERRLSEVAADFAKQKELVAKGQATERTLAVAQERLVEVQARLEAVRVNALERRLEQEGVRVVLRQSTEAAAERAALENELRNDAVALVDRLKRQEALAAGRGLASEQAVVEAQERAVEMRQRLRSAARQEADLERSVTGLRATRVAPTDSPIQPQDRLTIVVASEPDLPTGFTVRSDGSIRFPFLGTIRVQGSTARQVQAVITKLIVDKGLAQNPDVTVFVGRTLRRVR